MTNTDASAPATKADLNQLRAELGPIRQGIAQNATAISENAAAIAENKAAILSLRRELLLEIGAAASRTANVVIEQMRDIFGVLDDRYRDLPGRVSALEEELQRHIADDKRHVD